MEENTNKQSTETRECLIAEIERRVEDKILERTNADLLIKLIRQADTLTEAISIAQLGTTYKRTGIHYDKRIEKFGNTIKYFKKNEELSFSDGTGDAPNKLIIGDNYDALQNLLIEYRGKVDVIYIDPPYGKDSMGEFAQTNYENAITRDNLLSMLYPRLFLAKQLLSDDGIIYCSIDIKNYAYIKCLFDDIFGEANCITTLSWKKKKQPSYLSRVATVIEYVIVYSKNANLIKKLSIETLSDKDKRIINASNEMTVRTIKKGIRSKCGKDFLAKGTYKNKTSVIEILNDVYLEKGRTLNDFDCRARFRTGQDNINDYCDKDILFITKNIGFRRDLLDEEKTKAKAITDLLLDWGQNQDGSDELKDIFDINDDESTPFDNPKPTLLIKNLIKSSMKDTPIVLDFFAGSGTTGQALLELERGQFLLCQQIEINDRNPNGVAYDVTAKRLKRVMTGSCYDGTNDFKWLDDNEPLGGSLDVYEIASVSNAEQVAGKTAFDVIDETLYGKEKFATLDEKIKWVCENFELTQRSVENDAEWKKRQEGE